MKRLQGKAYVGRLSCSAFNSGLVLLRQIAATLGMAKFGVIHFNSGMHGRQHTEEEYQEAFPEFLNTIQRCAPKAKLIHVDNVHFNPQGIELQAGQVAARVEAMLPAR